MKMKKSERDALGRVDARVDAIEAKLAMLRREIEQCRRVRFLGGVLEHSLDEGLKVLVSPSVNRYLRSYAGAEGEDGYVTKLFGVDAEVVHDEGDRIFFVKEIK